MNYMDQLAEINVKMPQRFVRTSQRDDKNLLSSLKKCVHYDHDR